MIKRKLLPLLLLGFVLYSSIQAQDNWPSFRGTFASGQMEGQDLPDNWNGTSGSNIVWKRMIPGLAHSSPVIWGRKLFVTTAVSGLEGASFKHGLYGDGDASEDTTIHRWMVLCLDKNDGRILWERTAFTGRPREKRHIKSTYANSSPAVDGAYVAVFFGSQGLYVYSTDGKLLWSKDLGHLDIGAYDSPQYEWGPASSPIIYRDKVIIQVDTQTEDYVAAYDVKTGRELWKTDRDELPSWGTPTIVEAETGTELVTNSSNYIYGYDPETGKELWRLGGSSKITAPTPVHWKDLIVVCSGRHPEAPVFVLKTGARGDITLAEGESAGGPVLWSKVRRGSYMPTPLIYGGQLYVLHNQGRLDCYDILTGTEHYRQRLLHPGGGYSASPVASDGKIYLPGEDGEIIVAEAGIVYRRLARNEMGERLMATPAISGGRMYIRGEKHIYAIGKK